MLRDTSDIGIQRIIERQMRSWELQKTQRPSERQTAERKIFPFVAITRMVGSGGCQIAQTVGRRLGWPVFEKELLDYIATSPDARQQMADLLDERDVGWFEEILWPVTSGSRTSGRHDYFRKLCEAVFSVARQSPAVFLGRGTVWMLPRNIGIRVKIIASPQTCIRRFAERYKLDSAQAQKRIRQIERERNAFLNAHFPGRERDAYGYDLIVNTDCISIEMTAELIADAARIRSGTAPLEIAPAVAAKPPRDRLIPVMTR